MTHLAENTRISGLCCLMRVPNHAQKTSGEDRIRTCEGSNTPTDLANPRLRPLGHLSKQPLLCRPNHHSKQITLTHVPNDSADGATLFKFTNPGRCDKGQWNTSPSGNGQYNSDNPNDVVSAKNRHNSVFHFWRSKKPSLSSEYNPARKRVQILTVRRPVGATHELPHRFRQEVFRSPCGTV